MNFTMHKLITYSFDEDTEKSLSKITGYQIVIDNKEVYHVCVKGNIVSYVTNNPNYTKKINPFLLEKLYLLQDSTYKLKMKIRTKFINILYP